MTSKGAGWAGIAGLAALAGLGWVASGRAGGGVTSNPGERVTLLERRRSKRTLDDGVHTILRFSDGTTRRIQRMAAAEAYGIGGWHAIDGPPHEVHTWIADSEADAIAEILRKKNR